MLTEIYQSIDPIAFVIGPFTVRWYGIAYVLGFLVGAFVIYRVAKRWKEPLDTDSLLTLMLGIIIGVIVGARLGYVIFYGDGQYLKNPLSILAFNEGGMSFHGGLIGAVIGGFVVSKMLPLSFLRLADMVVIGAPWGLFFGRCANFINGELWGAPTTLPWGVIFGGDAGFIARHPSQLYEACLEGLVLFLILYALSYTHYAKQQGFCLGVFLVFYALFRFLIEFVRQPDAQIGYLWGDWLTMGQVLSVPLFIFGIALLVWSLLQLKKTS